MCRRVVGFKPDGCSHIIPSPEERPLPRLWLYRVPSRLSLATPTKWSQLPSGRFVTIQWPHPQSFSDPQHYGEMIWRDGTVAERSKNGVLVRLDSGGSIEIRSLAALQIDQTPEEMAKNSKRKGGA